MLNTKYIGMDVHQESISIAVMNCTSRRVSATSATAQLWLAPPPVRGTQPVWQTSPDQWQPLSFASRYFTFS